MDLSTLAAFRHELYTCFLASGDTLMNVVDALLTETTAQSFAELALSPFVERKWSSIYKAIEDGMVSRPAIRNVFANYAPHPKTGQRLVLVIDSSNVPRPESVTARDRTCIYVPNLPECKSPVSIGWKFSTLIVAPEQTSSWGYILENRRITSSQTPASVAAEQLYAVIPLLSERPLAVADRYYGSAVFLNLIRDIECDLLVRVPSNRRYYEEVGPQCAHQRGRPRKDGPIFRCKGPSTHREPDHTCDGTDDKGGEVRVDSWDNLHFKGSREVSLTLIRVRRSGATDKKSDPRVSWFIWMGKTEPELAEIWSTYKLRFSIEHGYRCDKQQLLWCTPRFRTPEEFELWTIIVGAVRNQLVLARPYVTGEHRLWESRYRAPTPAQVRRGMGRIVTLLGTPARPPKTRGLGAKGRQIGAVVTHAPRYPVIKKGQERTGRTDNRLLRVPPGPRILAVAQLC